MEFTRTYLLGVFITEGAVSVIGIGLVMFAVTKGSADTVSCLLLPICVLLLQLSVLLSSIFLRSHRWGIWVSRR